MKKKKESKVLLTDEIMAPEVLRDLYKNTYPQVEKMILQRGGDTHAAQDIFQDSLYIVYRKLVNNDLILSCKLSTYLFSVCKNLWTQYHRKTKNYIKTPPQDFQLVNDSELLHTTDLKLLALVDKHMKNLSPSCQKILQMHFRKNSIAEIQKALNYENEQYTMDRKYRCKSSLIKRIIKDPEFKEIKDEIKEKDNPFPGRNVI